MKALLFIAGALGVLVAVLELADDLEDRRDRQIEMMEEVLR